MNGKINSNFSYKTSVSQKKFKLILGLGNRDLKTTKKIALIYAKAGADVFDMSPFVLPFIQEEFVKNGLDLNKYTFCLSVSTMGDIHGKKAIVGSSCTNCGLCKSVCPQKAIGDIVEFDKCIGCGLCASVCKAGAISFKDIKTGFEELQNAIDNKKNKIDMVEIHISSPNKSFIENDFIKVANMFDGKISACLNRRYFSTTEAVSLLNKLQSIAGRKRFCVQADGNSMNGAKGSLESTLECLAFASALRPYGFDITLSGGTNSHTAKLARTCGLNCSVGFGTYARKLVLNAKTDEEALNEAFLLVKTVKGTNG